MVHLSHIRNTWKGYLLAFVLVVLMTLLKLPLADVLGYESRLIFFPVAVLLAAWFGGLGPGLLAVALTAVSFTFFFVEPAWRFHLDLFNAQQVVFYTLEATVYCALACFVQWSREKRRLSEEKASSILENIHDVFVALDRDWRITHVNRQAENILGQSAEKICGHVLWERWPQLLGTPAEKQLRKAMREGEPAHFETKDVITGYWYDSSVYPSEEGLSIFAREIDERKRAEQKLRESEQRLRLALQAAKMAAWEWNPTTGDVQVTESVEEVFGLPSIQHARDVIRLIHPDDRQHYQEVTDIAAEKGDSYHLTYRIIHPETDKAVWLEEWGYSEHDAEGRLRRLVGVTLDVTERKRAEDAVRDSETILQSILDQLPVGVIMANAASGAMTYYNEEARRQLKGMTRPASSHGDYDQYEAYHADGRPFEVSEVPLVRALRGEEVRDLEWHYPLPDGTTMMSLVSAGPIRSASGEIIRAVSAFSDISERKRMEEELERAKQEAEELAQTKTALLANMSHEVRTPLTGLLLLSEILAKRLSGENREKVLKIRKGAEKLSKMLDAVLTLSRLEAGDVEMKLDVVEIIEEVDHAFTSLAPLAEQKGLSLTFEGQAPCLALADDSSLNSILNNLIGNAIKFTDEGGVTVVIEKRTDKRVGGDAIMIHVKDTGRGISPEFLPYIFDEFRQESTGVKRSHGGAGLGLAISKRLVELMGGHIDVQSSRNRGTTFTITLKCPAEEETPEFPFIEASLSPNGEHLSVLAMDDDELMLAVVPELLATTCTVATASSSERALELARSMPFDVVLLDISMQDDNSGEEVLRALRRLPDYTNTPIIAMTAYALPGDRGRFLDMGFSAYIGKPFEGTELVETVRRTLAESAR